MYTELPEDLRPEVEIEVGTKTEAGTKVPRRAGKASHLYERTVLKEKC